MDLNQSATTPHGPGPRPPAESASQGRAHAGDETHNGVPLCIDAVRIAATSALVTLESPRTNYTLEKRRWPRAVSHKVSQGRNREPGTDSLFDQSSGCVYVTGCVYVKALTHVPPVESKVAVPVLNNRIKHTTD